ncbi:tetratricopeptide repeat protein [Mesonia sp.]|uniref:tetratricopeptide repeat protein n=1 Tax=Mesonia sp. TaxID=1960830 RepID=UPI003F959244
MYPLTFPSKVTLIKCLGLLFGLFSLSSCDEKIATQNTSDKESQKKIIQDYVYDCAQHHNYRFEMHQWQACLDKGLAKDSTIAYLWQQKAMPLFKARKYEAGMVFLDKAVHYDEKGYLAYRGFIKCIFAKTYKEAIKDFERIKALEGNSFVMDHTYNFHIALSYLQLNQFEKAEHLFKKDIEEQVKQWGEDGYHHLDLFYYGISLYEQQKWEEALIQFDKSLEKYPKFCEPMFYKALAMVQLEDYNDEEIATVFEKAKENKEAGNTINEDNAIYETYPYQIAK